MDPWRMNITDSTSYAYNMFCTAPAPPKNDSEPGNLTGNDVSSTVTAKKSNPESKRRRLKIADPTTWKRNMAKRKIQSGEAHLSVSGKEIAAKKVLPKDCSKCPRKCNDSISENTRQKIFDDYWNLSDINLKRLYLNALIDETDKSSVRTKKAVSKRTKSREFWLPRDGKRIRVCQGFFLATLNISNTVVANVLRKRNDQLIIEMDKRGKHKPAKKRPESAIQSIYEHINSFPKVVSQDGSKESASKLYLPGDLNLTKMYDLYLEKCDREKTKPEKQWLYRHVFHTKFNLSFQTPQKDSCNKCHKFDKVVKQLTFQHH